MTFIKDWFNKGNKAKVKEDLGKDCEITLPDLKPGSVFMTTDLAKIEKQAMATYGAEMEKQMKQREFERHMQQTARANAARAVAVANTTNTGKFGHPGATTGTVPKNGELPTPAELDKLIKAAPLPRWQAVVMAGAILEGQDVDEAVATAEAAVHTYTAEQRMKFDSADGAMLIKTYYEEAQRKAMNAAMSQMTASQAMDLKLQAEKLRQQVKQEEMASAYGMGTIRANKLYGRFIE